MSRADRNYFQRTGSSEASYVCWLLLEERRRASIAFTETPIGRYEEAMWSYPESERQSAYKQFEARWIEEVLQAKRRFRFKGYVARHFGWMPG